VVEDDVPRDTYYDFGCAPECSEWLHGAFFVNGFNLGRYHTAGPQKTLFIPGPFLHKGSNEVHQGFSYFTQTSLISKIMSLFMFQILIMELYRGSDEVRFTDTPNYGTPAI
jgi:hypothetical protein